MSTNRNSAPQSPAEVWLSHTFPLRHGLCGELGTDLRNRSPIPVEVPDKSFFGDLMERAIGLSSATSLRTRTCSGFSEKIAPLGSSARWATGRRAPTAPGGTTAARLHRPVCSSPPTVSFRSTGC